MNKFTKMISILCATTLTVATVAGCGGGNNTAEGELTIVYYDGGYGKDWLETIAADFKAENNCKVKLIDDTTSNCGATNDFTAKKVKDIYMCQSGATWTDFVRQGLLADLSDVYDATVTRTGANGQSEEVKIKNYIEPLALNRFKMQRFYGQSESKYWIMPWGSITLGLAVNLDMMNATLHTTTEQGWTAGEAWTTAQIGASIDNMLLYFGELDLDYSAGQAAMGLSSVDFHHVNNAIYSWWAQYQGVERANTANNVNYGSYYDFWRYEIYNESTEEWEYETGYDVLKQEGLKKGIETLQKCIVDADKKTYKNIPESYNDYNLTDVEQYFIQGRYATMFTGSFMENEVDYLNTTGMKYELIPFPNVEGAQLGEDGQPINVCVESINESIFVPKDAVNLDLAKKFLIFMCNEKYLMEFTKETGVMRPFQYDPMKLEPTYNWTDFQKSVFKMNNECDYKIYDYCALAETPSQIVVEKEPGMLGKAQALEFYEAMKYLTADQLLYTGGTYGKNIKFASVYDQTKREYQEWLREIG